MTVDVNTKIDLHHIVFAHHDLASCVRAVVCRAVIYAESSGEANTGLESISLLQPQVSAQMPHAVFDALCNLYEALPRLDGVLGPLPNLPVDCCCLSVVCEVVLVHPVQISLLLVGGAVCIIILVLDDFTLRIIFVRP